MNDDAQTKVKGEPQSGSAASYNPTTAHGTHNEPASGGNLVRDLMSVYESLTQSKTPQTSAQQQHDHQQQQQPLSHPYPQQQQQQQHPQYPHGPPGGSYPQQQQQQQQVATAFTIPPNPYQVPPPPPYPPTQQGGTTSHQAQPYYTDQPYGQQQQPYNVVPATEHAQQQQRQQPAYTVPSSGPLPPVGAAHASAGSVQSADQEDEANDSEEAEDPASSRGRRKRRGSDVSNASGKAPAKSRKKSKKASDGRWSKRFTWPEDLHRDFVSAIFDVGLKHSSPSTILEHMPKHEQITAERIKSHLQKYRMHRLKSKKEFTSSYESSLRNFQARGLTGVKSITSGEVAAHLTYSSLGEDGRTQSKPTIPKPNLQPTGDLSKGGNAQTQQQQQQNDALVLPQLTDAEKQSPIGAAMGYLMGLFFSLKQQLMIQRGIESGDKSKKNAPVQAVFNSFVSGNTMTSPARQAVPPGLTETAQTIPAGHPGSQPQQTGASTVLSAPSVRTNIEENSMMKQEMQNQMGLQRKMRALKEQELNKYKSAANSQQHETSPSASGPPMTTRTGEEAKDHQQHYHQHHHNVQHPSMPTKEEEAAAAAAHPAAASSTSEATAQGAGEPPGNDSTAPAQRSRQQSVSIGASDDFWNTDVVDEQLFEFLMNN